MRYTILAFHLTKVSRDATPTLDALVSRIESEGVTLAQGVYVLLPDKHKELLGEATKLLRDLGRGFACVTVPLDTAMAPFEILPQIQSQRDKIESWDV